MNGGKIPRRGSMPAPAIIPRSISRVVADALLEEQARLDERLQGEQLRQVLGRVGVAGDLRLAVLVEAVAAGLGAELALVDQLLHPLVDVEAVPVGLPQVLGHVDDRVEAEEVAEDERAHRRRVGPPATPSSIFLIESPCSSCSRQTSPTAELRMRLTTNPGTSAQVIGCLRIVCAKLMAASSGLLGGVLALDDLEQRHHRRRVEEVEAARPCRAAASPRPSR